MEVVCVILAMIAYQLFLGSWMSENADRARRSLGELVSTVGPLSKRQRHHTVVSIVFYWIMALFLFPYIYLSLDSVGRSFRYILFMQLILAFQFAGSAVAAWVGRHGVEIRERGIVHPGGMYPYVSLRTKSVTWDQVRYCVWRDWDDAWFFSWSLKSTTLLLVRCKSGDKKFNALDEQMPDLTAAILKYVDVQDTTYTIPRKHLKRPPDRVEIDTRPRASGTQESQWRFSLKTLMLFTVFVACCSAWIGIRYREASAEQAIIDSMVRFKPAVTERYGLELDFSASPNKPTDADMASLGKLHRLKCLYLPDAPITDAGLAHLEGLTELSILNIKGTQVTRRGIARLKKALPDIMILEP